MGDKVYRVPLVMPKLGLIDETVVILHWLKVEGDAIVQGEPVVQVETEKANVDVEAPVSGNLLRIARREGDSVDVGALLAEIAVAQPPASADASAASVPASRIRATPAATHLARELRIALEPINGTGPRGRIQLRDVKAITALSTLRRELTPMRRAVARSMTHSASAIPQFTVSRHVSWKQLNDLMYALATSPERSGVKPSLNDFLIQAAARSLMAHPDLNAVFVGDPDRSDAHIQAVTGAHIGIVVAVDEGLLVPVMHQVENLAIPEIARLRSDIVARAKSGRLRPNELSGAVLSISNLGAGGPDRFTALINPGESAILTIGRSRDVCVVEAGQIVVRPVSELTLTVDHRLTDGRGATGFLNTLAALIEGRDWHRFSQGKA